MRVEFSEAVPGLEGWAELRERQTFADRLAIRRATQWETAVLVRAITSWSLGPVTEEAIAELDPDVGDTLINRLTELWNPQKGPTGTLDEKLDLFESLKSGATPAEFLDIAIAREFGCSPEDVRERWAVEDFERVLMYLEVEAMVIKQRSGATGEPQREWEENEVTTMRKAAEAALRAVEAPVATPA